MLKFIKTLFEKDPLLDKAIIAGLEEENKLQAVLLKQAKREIERLIKKLNTALKRKY
jgi:hypothetical protein